jgi:hypothetical protein
MKTEDLLLLIDSLFKDCVQADTEFQTKSSKYDKETNQEKINEKQISNKNRTKNTRENQFR